MSALTASVLCYRTKCVTCGKLAVLNTYYFGCRCSEALRLVQAFLRRPKDLVSAELALSPILCDQKRAELLVYKLLNQFDSPAARLKVSQHLHVVFRVPKGGWREAFRIELCTTFCEKPLGHSPVPCCAGLFFLVAVHRVLVSTPDALERKECSDSNSSGTCKRLSLNVRLRLFFAEVTDGTRTDCFPHMRVLSFPCFFSPVCIRRTGRREDLPVSFVTFALRCSLSFSRSSSFSGAFVSPAGKKAFIDARLRARGISGPERGVADEGRLLTSTTAAGKTNPDIISPTRAKHAIGRV